MSTGCVIVLHVDFTQWHHDYQRAKPVVQAPQVAAQGLPVSGNQPLSPPTSASTNQPPLSTEDDPASTNQDKAVADGE